MYMLLLCEVAVKGLLPPTRAALAKELTTRHGFKQVEVAKLLGVSQPAISLYNRKMRGKALNLEKDEEIKKLIENLADSLVEKNMSHKDFILKFCEICKAARAKGLLCQMHKTLDPSFDVEKCDLCATELIKCV
jgi:predicted transcriptional regulator